MKVARINSNGFEQIAAALREHHRYVRKYGNSPSMVLAWAAEAEKSFADGNGCGFEISAHISNSGRPVVIDITPEGYDVVEMADE
jgi:hypothetical protein